MISTQLRLSGVLPALVLATSAAIAGGTHGDHSIGQPGEAGTATRTVNVDMTDSMRFTPAEISVQPGETVRFVVRNVGLVKHEMVLGTAADIKEHYAMMMKMPDMAHTGENQVSVAPGKIGEIVWRFTNDGIIDFACLQPGHYGAGMKGAIRVGQRAPRTAADGPTVHKH